MRVVSALLRRLPELPPPLRAMLQADRGALPPPIRAEVFGAQRFALHGRSLGETHQAGPARRGDTAFFPRLHDNILVLGEAHRCIGLQAATGQDISPAAEWLLDNFHLIEAQIKAVREGLPRQYFRNLPLLQKAPLAGLPRIYGVAWSFVAHCDGAIDEDLLVVFLLAYQQTRALALRELWALPTSLRVVLIENLRRLAERVATNKAARELANLCCDNLPLCSPHALVTLLPGLRARGVETVFLSQMAQRLRDQGSAHPQEAEALRAWLHAQLPDLSGALAQQAADQAADNLSVSNAVTSLRAVGELDWLGTVARASAVMTLMLRSPLFAAEEASTQAQTLHGIERLAQRGDISELQVAQTLMGLMDEALAAGCVDAIPAHWLHGAARPALLRALNLQDGIPTRWAGALRRQALPLYLGSAAVATGLLLWALWPQGPVALSSHGLGSLLALLALMSLPASQAVLLILNRVVSESTRPRTLPRLALLEGIPAAHRVLVAIPAILSDTATCRELVHSLHRHHLANPEEEAQFALLTDWSDADTREHANDAALMQGVVAQIAALNAAHPRDTAGMAPRFIVLHRDRRYSEGERSWMGWERKRGKLEQLVDAMARGDGSAFVNLGEASRLMPATPYLLTLDSDTRLPPGRLRELVGMAAHPQNHPRLDTSGRRVQSGYGILQPRIVTALPTRRERTTFHWLFAGRCGLDPYSAASSEVYQDLFGEGSFSGKGLLHVRTVHAVLAGRLPEGKILSHDLLEGALVRCAAVSDITLIEGAPNHADVASARLQRWTRGDWQLLPFLLHPKAQALRAIDCWKMTDNLRRSLLTPACWILLWAGLLAPGSPADMPSPWRLLGLVLIALSGGPLLGALAGMSSLHAHLAPRPFYRHTLTEIGRALLAGLWQLAQLQQNALQSLEAICLALYRVFISHRRLLEWASGASVQALSRTKLPPLLRQHLREPLVAMLGLGLLLMLDTPHPALAWALSTLWASSPLWIWLSSRPSHQRSASGLNRAEQVQLGGIARDTWRYFERCVTAQEHHLPPDNLQTDPHDTIAHRTSPTNIGLYLLSAACARNFGWLGTMDFIERLEATLTTLDGLPRHRGHFLNWYDTSKAQPLLPLYVSTVDSGNLSSHLLAVSQACLELASMPLDGSASQSAISAARLRLKSGTNKTVMAADDRECEESSRDELHWRLDDLRATLRSAEHDAQARARPGGASEASLRLRELARRCDQLAWAPDYRFLWHAKRHLLHIGYRVADDTLDASFYDLLASESRLTSLLAIAKGDLPVLHWAALSRPFCAIGSTAGLLSWSGSMFEYLMPTLVCEEPWGSALQVAGLAAVRAQMTWGDNLDMPWGISESAYAGRDDTLAYQYAPQGVPDLALRRTPPDERVVAPYATALAAMHCPRHACRNFDLLTRLGARDRYGFIEAIDFSPARQRARSQGTPVRTFMAHHQGMVIVSLSNVLQDGPAQRWGMAHPRLQAIEALLHEWSPHEVSVLQEGRSSEPAQSPHQHTQGLLRTIEPGQSAIEPTHALSNGRYHMTLRANGAGYSHWGDIGLGREQDDALRDACGHFFHLRSAPRAQLNTLTSHPTPSPGIQHHCTFHPDRVCFEAHGPGWLAQLIVWVSPEDDIAFHQVTLHNLSHQALDTELISAFEPTLVAPRADQAHPAFSQLFLSASWLAEQQALTFERRARIASERSLHLAHFLTGSDPQVMAVRGQTQRARWLGRHHDPGRPLAEVHDLPAWREGDPTATLPLDTGLDPVCVLAVQLHVLPRGKVQLTFGTAVSPHPETLRAMVDKHRQACHVQRASLMSATLSGIRLRQWHISPEHMGAIQSLQTALLLTLSRPAAATVPLNAIRPLDRRLLWRHGLSGERPMLLLTMSVMQGLGLVRNLAHALSLWRWSGIACDLVVVNDEPGSYQMPLQRELTALHARYLADLGQAGTRLDHFSPCGFHLLKADALDPPVLATLQGLARVHLQADGRPLGRQVQAWLAAHEQALVTRQETQAHVMPLSGTPSSDAQPPRGQFEAGGARFHFRVSGTMRPGRPWLNVLANPDFGTHVSDAGNGPTWARNSRLNQLTAWSNDAVADPPSELFCLQDTRLGTLCTLTPTAWGWPQAEHEISHQPGLSSMWHRQPGLRILMSWSVDPVHAVKQVRITLHNEGSGSRHLRLAGMAEWQMGAQRGDRRTLHTHLCRQPSPRSRLDALLCTQRDQAGGFGLGTSFFALCSPDQAQADWTCDRRELYNPAGHRVLPAQLGRQAGSGLDPCATWVTSFVLQAGEMREIVFLLGHADTPLAAIALASLASAESASLREHASVDAWAALLEATTVHTPDPLFDALVNHWLLYQTVACRLWAKAGFYQAGGATGFRDQLQDTLALSWAAPELLRAQILIHAARQFPEGDVQHWWHQPGGAGVRTHFSDDLLWLPWACVHHLRHTGDTSLLGERVPFIEGPPVPPDAEDRYDTPCLSDQSASVYEHAARAIDRSLRAGRHGLPLIGTGDWNDGMNRVGPEGQGESVWLAWFLVRLVADFVPLAMARGEDVRAARWSEAAKGWLSALNAPEGPVWDGNWFTRAFFDDGSPLGSHACQEGRIDLIAQAWSVLSGLARPELADRAMASVDTCLVDPESGLLRLLNPPFVHGTPSPGYIQSYPPGVRENGGQYNHAGVWALMAVARQSQDRRTQAEHDAFADRAYSYFCALSPAHRSQHPTFGQAYGLEPYAMAADVYSQPPYKGCGGWSWYTGSASWLHRAAIESIFGLDVRGSVAGPMRLRFTPCLPTHWPQAELSLKREGRHMRFILVRATAADALRIAHQSAAGTPENVRLLRVGEWLDWSHLPAGSCFVLPLLGEEPAAAFRAD